MKAKKFNNKLSLNKRTIANLSAEDQLALKGGNLDPTYTEPTFDQECDPTTDTTGGGGATQWCIMTNEISICICTAVNPGSC